LRLFCQNRVDIDLKQVIFARNLKPGVRIKLLRKLDVVFFLAHLLSGPTKCFDRGRQMGHGCKVVRLPPPDFGGLT
jgi:hypothetical protein